MPDGLTEEQAQQVQGLLALVLESLNHDALKSANRGAGNPQSFHYERCITKTTEVKAIVDAGA